MTMSEELHNILKLFRVIQGQADGGSLINNHQDLFILPPSLYKM